MFGTGKDEAEGSAVGHCWTLDNANSNGTAILFKCGGVGKHVPMFYLSSVMVLVVAVVAVLSRQCVQCGMK